ncbi:MAG: transketolase C-terminal domain-containing protein, partial [Candidatus Woesearchaeota archaeon]|nr:transketolase C-terminal domain-containing protein [Candidatus Woesearchaeota archaeon]
MHLIKDLSKAENVPTRDGMGKGLVELGKTNKNVVALCCDLTDSTRIGWFKEKFPKRYVQVGVQEQNMMGIGAGMALEGKIPFVSSYAVFSPGRNWDQLRVSVCYGDANVKIIGAHAGISVGPDGATHQALEDVAITRVLPNLTVLVPADSSQAFKATLASVDISGPVYLRIGRDKFPNFTTDKTPFTVGKADIYRDGKDVAIVACGVMVYEALLAAEELEKKGIDAMVVNNHTIKPIDEKTLV